MPQRSLETSQLEGEWGAKMESNSERASLNLWVPQLGL